MLIYSGSDPLATLVFQFWHLCTFICNLYIHFIFTAGSGQLEPPPDMCLKLRGLQLCRQPCLESWSLSIFLFRLLYLLQDVQYAATVQQLGDVADKQLSCYQTSELFSSGKNKHFLIQTSLLIARCAVCCIQIVLLWRNSFIWVEEQKILNSLEVF